MRLRFCSSRVLHFFFFAAVPAPDIIYWCLQFLCLGSNQVQLFAQGRAEVLGAIATRTLYALFEILRECVLSHDVWDSSCFCESLPTAMIQKRKLQFVNICVWPGRAYDHPLYSGSCLRVLGLVRVCFIM